MTFQEMFWTSKAKFFGINLVVSVEWKYTNENVTKFSPKKAPTDDGMKHQHIDGDKTADFWPSKPSALDVADFSEALQDIFFFLTTGPLYALE